MKTILLLIAITLISSCKKKEIEEQCYECEHKQYYEVDGQRVEAERFVYYEEEVCGEAPNGNTNEESGEFVIGGELKEAKRIYWTQCKAINN